MRNVDGVTVFKFMGTRVWSQIVRRNRLRRLKERWEGEMTPEMHMDTLTILKRHKDLLTELRRHLVEGTWHGFQDLLKLGIKGAKQELRKRKDLFKQRFCATFKIKKKSKEAEAIYETVFGKIDPFYLTEIADKMDTLAKGNLRAIILGKLKSTSKYLESMQKDLEEDEGFSRGAVDQILSEEGSKFIMECMSITTEDLWLIKFLGNDAYYKILCQKRARTLKQNWEETVTPTMQKDALTILQKHPDLLKKLRKNIVQGSWDGFRGLLMLGIKGASKKLKKRNSLSQGTSKSSR